MAWNDTLCMYVYSAPTGLFGETVTIIRTLLTVIIKSTISPQSKSNLDQLNMLKAVLDLIIP